LTFFVETKVENIIIDSNPGFLTIKQIDAGKFNLQVSLSALTMRGV